MKKHVLLFLIEVSNERHQKGKKSIKRTWLTENKSV